MKLLIKQRVFALSDTYDVYDENEQVKYFVKAKAFSLGHQITIYDQNDEEIGEIKQKVWHFLPTFIIEINGQELGYVRKAFSLFKPKYEIDFNGWICKGDFLAWDYNVYDQERLVVNIYKEPFHWGDTYILDIGDPQDEIMALMLTIAIDAANCNGGASVNVGIHS